MPAREGGLFCIEFSKDGTKLLTTAGDFNFDDCESGLCWIDCAAVVYDAATGQITTRLEGHEEYVFHASFSPDGRHVATASGDKSLRIWNIELGRETRRFTGHTDIVSNVRFSSDGRFVISSSRDGTIRKWDTSD